MTQPFTGQSFKTAAAARVGKPLAFQVETAIVDAEGNVTATSVVCKVNPLLDTVRLGSALGSLSEFGGTLRKFGGSRDDAEAMTAAIAAIEDAVPNVRAAIRACLVESSREVWDSVSESVDVLTLGSIVAYIGQELSGVDPTGQASSSTGSEPTGSSSTAGVQLAV